MNTFTFKNSSAKYIESTSKTTLKLRNIETEINTITLDTPLTILSGSFDSEINIIDNCLLDLDSDFTLNNSYINLINNELIEKEIFIVGTVDKLSSELKINSDNNIILFLAIFTKTESLSSIDVNINPTKAVNDSFKLTSINNWSNSNKPEINLQITNTQNIIIDSDLKTFNTGTSANMKLLVSEKSNIREFKNVKNTTFNSVTASERVIEVIENSSSIRVPITSLFFKTDIINGTGTILVPASRNIPNEPQTNILLSSIPQPI